MSATNVIARLRELRAKATPGAWLAAAKPSSIVGWPIIAPRSPGAMSVCNVHTGHEYSAANAAAIVAAMNSLESLLACADLVATLHDIWNDAQDDCDKGGFVEDHILKHVAAYTDNDPETAARHLLCDLVEKVGRKARLALQALAEGGGE